ncbi:unnamed protein product [Rotaria sp. Silwood2]|nr:unnamed protein product [Rotaria sp. Silwood2]CAF2837428.1 unnamed protein product [Rotaria sp. Silwood2]CAF2985935.1 unnamed protein product [Rotaria sp. Silwood2]CAF3351061.1 unnamed protein product [Rotaria sp. Silwood2]CAF4063261.1 unnamed protein product [Rotaria sp. Silwood2]
MVQLSSLVRFTPQHQQQQSSPSSTNMPPSLLHPSMVHSNMHQQQAFVSTFQLFVNITASIPSLMTNPTGSSTPISTQTKRGRIDISGASKLSIELRS